MAIRTTSTIVKSILLKDYDSDDEPSLDIFIEMANTVVDNLATLASDNDETIPTATLALIEALVAAHFYQAPDPGYSSKSTSGASGSFLGSTSGEGLKETRYGRRALSLDPSGWLEAIAVGAVAKGFWLGTQDSLKRTYNERNGYTR